MPRKKKKKNLTWLWVLLGAIVLGGLLWYGASQGLFANLQIPQIFSPTFNFDKLPRPDSYISEDADYEVKLELIPPAICVGDQTTGRITSNMPRAYCRIFVSINNGAWQTLADIRLNNNGNFEQTETILSSGRARFVTICCDNDFRCKSSNFANLVVDPCDSVPPTDDGLQIGDIIGGGSGSGTITGSSPGVIAEFDLTNLEEGDCYIGAKIYITWSYAKDNYWDECSTLGGYLQGMEWTFTDNSGVVWSAIDEQPNTHSVTICPLDIRKKLKLYAIPLYEIPQCEIKYSYNIELYVCGGC